MSSKTQQPDMTRDRLVDLVKGQRVAMLCSADNDGALHSRPMTVLKLDADSVFWFFCEPAAGEPEQRAVNLAFVDEARALQVSVSGQARIVRDRGQIRALWTAMARPWFPDGVDSPNLALLAVTPDHVAYWDGPDSRIVRGMALAASVIAGKPLGLGVHDEGAPAAAARAS